MVFGKLELSEGAITTHNDSYVLHGISAISTRRPFLSSGLAMAGLIALFVPGTFDILHTDELLLLMTSAGLSLALEVGEIIKMLEPTTQLIALAKAMFRHAWDQRIAQAQDALRSGQRQIKDIDKQIEAVLDRILSSSNATVIQTYEAKIAELEKFKAIAAQQLENQDIPAGSYEEKLEPVLTFLANPWKLWETGHINLRRMVLKPAFAGRITYDRNEGARTPQIALPFKALAGFDKGRVCFGAGEGTRTPTPKAPEPKSGASTNSATPATSRPLAKQMRGCERYSPKPGAEIARQQARHRL